MNRKPTTGTVRLNSISLSITCKERAKTAAEEANLAKSDFLTAMSQEIRTPMNTILGMANKLCKS